MTTDPELDTELDEIFNNLDVGAFPNDGWSDKAKQAIQTIITRKEQEAYKKGWHDCLARIKKFKKGQDE